MLAAMSRLSTVISSAFFHGLSRAGRLHPASNPARHGVEVERDLRYGPAAEHILDLYRPHKHPGPWPVVFYVHGGAFQILSKDTHWLMGLAFARRGYLVVNISYRLAPRHRFPAARTGLLSCTSSRCQRPSVLPFRAAIPHAGLPPASALVGAQAVAGLRPLGALPVRSPRQRSRLRLHRDAEQLGAAGVAGRMTTAALSRAR